MIDASIPLLVRPPQMLSPQQQQQEQLKLKQMGLENTHVGLENTVIQNSIDSDRAISDAMREGYGGDPSLVGPQQPQEAPPPQPPAGAPPPQAPTQVPAQAPPTRLDEIGKIEPASPQLPSPAPIPPPAAAPPEPAPEPPAAATGGVPKFDQGKYIRSVVNAGQGAKGMAVLKGFQEAEEKSALLAKTKAEVDEKWRDAAAAVAASARYTDANGETHYNADMIQGQLYHDMIVMNSPTAAMALHNLQSVHGPQRQQLADEYGKRLEAGGSPARLNERREQQKTDEEAAAKKVVNASSQLADALNKPDRTRAVAEYTKVYRGLPAATAARFPKPDELNDSDTPASMRDKGMTPVQQADAAHQRAMEQHQKDTEADLKQYREENLRLSRMRADLALQRFKAQEAADARFMPTAPGGAAAAVGQPQPASSIGLQRTARARALQPPTPGPAAGQPPSTAPSEPTAQTPPAVAPASVPIGGTLPGWTDDTGAHGADYLKMIAPDAASEVKAYAEGRRPFPTGFALKSPYFQNLIRAVGQYDPSFDASNYNARNKARSDFISPNGTAGKQINALNTAVGHLDELAQAAEALKNGDTQLYNKVANGLKTQFGWSGKTDFDTIAPKVADEVERLWRGSGGSEGSIERTLGSLNSDMGPGQLRSAISKTGKLIESKLSSLEQQRDQALGPFGGDIKIIFPKSRTTLDRLEGAASAGKPDTGTPPEGTESVVNGVQVVWKTVDGKPGWYKK